MIVHTLSLHWLNRSIRAACTALGLSLALSLATSSCARPQPPAVAPVVDHRAQLQAAGGLVRAGCLECLVDAYEQYLALRAFPEVADDATTGAVRTAILVSIRQRELGMVDTGYLAQAAELLANAFAPSESLTRLLEIVPDLPLAPGGRRAALSDPDVVSMLRFGRNRAEWTDYVRGLAADDELAAYVWLALACEPSSSITLDDRLRPIEAFKDEPLLLFKEAVTCSRSAQKITSLLDRDARFKELHYALGLARLSRQPRPGMPEGVPDLDGADAEFRLAYDWHPDWPALTLAIGNLAITAEDFERSLEFYEKTLSMVPQISDALLGRVRSLTYLTRNEDAMAAADMLLADGRYPGDARYWRAFNENQLARYEDAWADVQLAAKLVRSADVLKLTGLIEIHRRELEVARTSLENARRLNASDCEISYYLQTVLLQQGSWKDGEQIASAAAACFDAEELNLTQAIERLRAADIDPGRKERQAARREAQLSANRRMRAQSWFNGAVANLNLSRREEARRLAEKVADDDEFGERARAILNRVGH